VMFICDLFEIFADFGEGCLGFIVCLPYSMGCFGFIWRGESELKVGGRC